MPKIPCGICGEQGTVQQGRNCPGCNGEGEIEAPDGFHMSVAHMISMYRMLVDFKTKFDTLDTKMDTLETHLDSIETKIDAL